MGKSLVIVESPAKARTIAGFLGPDFTVESSVGHIRDLPDRAGYVPKEKRKRFGALGVGGQFTKKGKPMTMCQQIDYVVKTKGMDHAIKHYTKEGHKVADYKAPGQVEK